jgi:CRP/FNR family transcriptional regulator, dissimilatory nitrate respiration regulator
MMNVLTLQQLPPELQQSLTTLALTPGQLLIQQGEPAEAIYFLESGRVRLVSFAEEQIITHSFIHAGESFVETALFSDTYACTAIAEVASRVSVISKQRFLDALHSSATLTEVYIRQLTQRFLNLKILLELRSIRSARERILRYLSLNVQPDGVTVNLQRSLKDWASELGLAADVVSRVLRQLHDEGTITRRKRQITLNED